MDEINTEIPRIFGDLLKPARYKIYYGGRGGAKSWNFARVLLEMAWQKPLQVLCAREVQKSIKESVYNLLKTQIEQLGLGYHYEVLTNEIRGKNGSRFIFEGLKDNTVENIKSFENTDICWIEEANAVSDSSWEILIPTIRKKGSEIWITFNPRLEFDATYQRFIKDPPPNAIVKKVSWRDNPFFTDEMRFEMERLKATNLESYLHVWEGELKTIAEGAIYAKQINDARHAGRICAIPVENSVLVNTFWDLGKNDATAIWWHQGIGPQNRFIDYYENRGLELEDYIRVVKGMVPESDMQRLKVTKEDNKRRERYMYQRHYLPHDVEAQILGMPKTRYRQLLDADIKPIKVVERVRVLEEGIESMRRAFPTCWFDEQRCKDGIAALSNYAWEYDEEKNVYSRLPIHNWASHGSDALRQFAQAYTMTKPANDDGYRARRTRTNKSFMSA